MPRTIVIEEFTEFAERHSKDGKPVRFRHLILFPDGAHVLASNSDMRWEPPPAGTLGYFQALRDYHEAALAEAEEKYRRTESAFTQNAELSLKYSDWASCPPTNADEVLDALEAVVCRHQEKLREYREKLAAAEAGTPANTIAALESQRKARVVEIQSRMLNRSQV